MKNNLLIILLTTFGLAFNFSNYGGEIFRENISARAGAMGGISSIDDRSLNPAFVINYEINDLKISHKKKYGDLVNINLLSYSRLINASPYSFVYLNSNINNIPNTMSAWNDNGDGIIEIDEINYNEITMFNHSEYGFLISSAKKLNNFKIAPNRYLSLPIGIRLKTNFSLIEQNYGLGMMFDTGTFINLSENVIFHTWVENVLNFKYWSTKNLEFIYPNLIIGGHYKSNKISFSMETNINSENDRFSSILDFYKIGIEYISLEEVNIRVGTSYTNIFTSGFGFSLDIIQIDYALMISKVNNIFPPTHQFELSFDPKYLKKYLTK
tara:strand:+ start:729 stop:1703 length:975 start_codon:yes stop_codon:yes gene_type:complete